MRFIFILSLFSTFTVFASPPAKNNMAYKVILLKINDAGLITDGLDSIALTDVAQYIRERLFKNYSGTGKMYDKIRIEKRGEHVTESSIEALVKEIKAGQKLALAEFCLHRYKKTFDELDKKQQQRLEKRYPVLFQSSFT